MYNITLKNVPNQSFNIVLNGQDYRLHVRTINGLTYISAWQDDEILFYSQLCTPNNWVNPYKYVSDNGKLYFKCINGDYPTYTEFGITQELYFLTPEEVEVMQ